MNSHSEPIPINKKSYTTYNIGSLSSSIGLNYDLKTSPLYSTSIPVDQSSVLLSSSVSSSTSSLSNSRIESFDSNSLVSNDNTKKHLRARSLSDADTLNLAKKWGFTINEDKTKPTPRRSQTNPFNNNTGKGLTSLYNLGSGSATLPRCKSPMRDMILNGQFLD